METKNNKVAGRERGKNKTFHGLGPKMLGESLENIRQGGRSFRKTSFAKKEKLTRLVKLQT